ncbi:MAG: tetratricopeptide repeat protein, partial [Candidatus Binatia bacterium]
WCGPCRTLGPVLERLAALHGGKFVLARINVDENPQIAEALGVRGIPAVKAFRDGEIVEEFVGALPEESVRSFLARILPSDADRLASEASAADARGARDEAEALYHRALELDVNHPGARLGLARRIAERDPSAALAELERVLPGTPERAAADRIAARIRIGQEGTNGRAELEKRVTDHPRDLDARLRLARLLAASEEYEPALQQLLEVVRYDRDFEDQAARRAMLDVFEILGSGHELTEKYRAELARILFS